MYIYKNKANFIETPLARKNGDYENTMYNFNIKS